MGNNILSVFSVILDARVRNLVFRIDGACEHKLLDLKKYQIDDSCTPLVVESTATNALSRYYLRVDNEQKKPIMQAFIFPAQAVCYRPMLQPLVAHLEPLEKRDMKDYIVMHVRSGDWRAMLQGMLVALFDSV